MSPAVTARPREVGPDDDAREPRLEIGVAGGEREDGHDLAGGGDVEALLAEHAVCLAAHADDAAAEEAVVHVERATPGDLPRIELTTERGELGGGVERDARRLAGVAGELVAEVGGVVDQRRQEIVRRGDGVDVAGEMQVDVVGGDEARLAAAGAAALHAEDRTERRLAQASTAFFPICRSPMARPIEVVVFPSPAGVGLIAVTRMSRPSALLDARARLRGEPLHRRHLDLRLAAPVGLDLLRGETELSGDVSDRGEARGWSWSGAPPAAARLRCTDVRTARGPAGKSRIICSV